jgi:RNA polymerase sigma-70 factor, ECF subfamily
MLLAIVGAVRQVRAQGGPDGRAPDIRAAPSAALDALQDDQLVLLVCTREPVAERALDELYQRYASAVYGLARRVVGDNGTAEDVLQETFWRVWRGAAHYQPGRVRFATWLLRIAHNTAVSECRSAARRPQRATPTSGDDGASSDGMAALMRMADSAPDVPDQVWLAEQRRAIIDGLGGLPAEQREAVELAYYGGMTHAQIAARQGAPLSTVKTRLALGLRKLADHLTARRMEPAASLESADASRV